MHYGILSGLLSVLRDLGYYASGKYGFKCSNVLGLYNFQTSSAVTNFGLPVSDVCAVIHDTRS